MALPTCPQPLPAAVPAPMPASPVVALLVYPGFQAIDLAGPVQAFVTAAGERGPAYDVRIVSTMGGPVKGTGPLAVLTQPWNELSLPVDTLMVPGGPGVDAACGEPALRLALTTMAASARRICSVCTGAFLLASSGLLDGRAACTHWRAAERLARAYPGVRVDPVPIYLRDDNVYTSAGVSAGIDLALALIEEDAGTSCAAAVAKRLVVHMRRPGGQAQYSDALRLQTNSAGTFGELLAQIAARPAEPWRAEDMAAYSGHSVRSFYRKFMEQTQESPSAALERIRVEHATAMLNTTAASLKEVARRSGFASEQAMRRSFLRVAGRLPSSIVRGTTGNRHEAA